MTATQRPGSPTDAAAPVGHATAARNAPLWAPGVTLGAIGAAAMVGPSLFPKNPKLQAAGVVAAAAIGMGIGTGVEAVSRGVDKVLPGDRLTAQLAVGGTGAALAGTIALASHLRGGGSAKGVAAAAQSAGIILAAGGLAGAASTAVARADEQIPGHDLLAQGAVVAVAGGAMLGVSLAGMRGMRGATYLLPDLPELVANEKTFGQLVVDHGVGIRGKLTTGAADSAAPYELLHPSGKNFLTQVPSTPEIAKVMGVAETQVKDPIRGAISLAHTPEGLNEAEGVAWRVKTGLDRLDDLGAFGKWTVAPDGKVTVLSLPRKSFLAAGPTSTGYINPLAVSSHEFMEHGDSAALLIQSGTTKAAGEMHHVARATATHQVLLEGIKTRLDALPPEVLEQAGGRPHVRVYGESFGAWTSQNGFAGDGAHTMPRTAKVLGKWNGPTSFPSDGALGRYDQLGIDHAMYVGTPTFSPFRTKLLADPALTGGATPKVAQVRNLQDAKALGAETAEDLRVTFLQHDADPVGLFSPKILYERPDYLGPRALRGQNVPKQQRFIPIITGIQTGIDQQTAQSFTKGVLEEKGHDYRPAVGYVMRRAYGKAEVTDRQISAMREWGRQLEVLGAERTKAGLPVS